MGSDGADGTGGASSRDMVLNDDGIAVPRTYVCFSSLDCPEFMLMIVIM